MPRSARSWKAPWTGKVNKDRGHRFVRVQIPRHPVFHRQNGRIPCYCYRATGALKGVMSRLLLLLLVLALFLPATSHAQQGMGVGVFFGEPSGLSTKTWLTHTTAFDAAAAWSMEEGNFHVHGDYLVHNFNVFHV